MYYFSMIRCGFLSSDSSAPLGSVWIDKFFLADLRYDGHDSNNSTIIHKYEVLLPGNQSTGHSFISIILIVFILFSLGE